MGKGAHRGAPLRPRFHGGDNIRAKQASAYMHVKTDPATMLTEGADALGVALTEGQRDSLLTCLSELLKWNKKINLTAIDNPGDAVVKHLLDSLALCRMLPDGPFRAADIGSGAGFPGLAVKVARPDMDITLVEPSRKKTAFLKHLIRLLKLDGAEAAALKVEDMAGTHGGRFDVILSRAFKEPSLLLPLVAPLLSAGGKVILSLGPGPCSAVPEGWTLAGAEDISLPFSDISRRLVLYEMQRPPGRG